MAPAPTRFSATKRRPNGWIIAAIIVLHLALFYGLLRAFAPGVTSTIERGVVSTFTVEVTAPEEPPPPEAEPEDEGAQGDPGAEAVAAPVTAPPVPQPIRTDAPAPRVASTGTASRSGAADTGDGPGRAGSGSGPGSGRGGDGQGGGGAVTKPSVRSGAISSARDFPIPPGGRSVRDGTSVTVAFTVGVDGRASNCSVTRPGPDPETNALVCPLVIERITFNPARNAAGEPVPARYGWRQDFFAR